MARRSWFYVLSSILLPVSAGLYTTSLFMDIFRIERSMKILGMGKVESEAYRLFGAIEHLWKDGEITLAVIITAFSFVFPVAKYLALGFVMLARSPRRRGRVLTWIKNLGQWSMGDVFVVALMVVIARVDNGIAMLSVDPRPGLWVFASSVVLAMIVSALLSFEPGSAREATTSSAPDADAGEDDDVVAAQARS